VDKDTGGARADTGTSMATPHVSGGIALLIEAFPNATVHQIREAILASGRQMSASEPIEKVGRGFVDFEAAYNILLNTTSAELGDNTFAMTSAPRVIKDENYVFRQQISGTTKTLPFFIHSSRNVTLKPMVENNPFVTRGVEFQLPETIEVTAGINKFYMNITVTSTDIEFIGGRVFFQDNSSNMLLQYANISYFALVKYPQAKILFDSTKDFDAYSTTYFAGHSPRGQFSYFAKLLEIEGHTVDENRDGDITSSLLSNYDMLVIANPDLAYAQDEIAAIRSFVFDEGKALLVIAGGGLIVAETKIYEKFNEATLESILLGSGLGFKRNNQNVVLPSIEQCHELGILNRFSSCFSNAETTKNQEVLPKLIEFPQYGPSLEANTVVGYNVQSVAKYKGQTVIASSEVASTKGRILLFSSPLLFDNKGLIFGYNNNGGDTSNNKLLSTSAISWLLEPRSVNVEYKINGKDIDTQVDVDLHETITIEFRVSTPNGQTLQLNTNQLNVSILQRDPDFAFPLFGKLVFEKTLEGTYRFQTTLDKFGSYEFFVFVTDPAGQLISSNGHIILNAALRNFYDQDEIRYLGIYLFFAITVTWVLFIYNEGGRQRFLKREIEKEVN
ncbi:MAG: S8 family serine peptidase, partial [Candidatus Heimdallarchaeota archaeon]